MTTVLDALRARLDANVLLGLSTLLVAMVAAYFAFLQARAAAKPRIVISMLHSGPFDPAADVCLTINLRNHSYFYAQPTATDVCAYVNVDPAIALQELRFGSMQFRVDTDVKKGKDNSRYLKAVGITLLPNQSESLELRAKVPRAEGRYRLWVDVRTGQGSSASFRTLLDVRG